MVLAGRAAGGRRLVGQNAEKRRHRETDFVGNEFRLVALGASVPTDGDQRHAQPIGVILVGQSLHVVVRDELEAVEILGRPARSVDRDRHVPMVASRFDRVRVPGHQAAPFADNPHAAFQRAVVQVAGLAKLGIVRVSKLGKPRVEQIQVSVIDGARHRGRAPRRRSWIPASWRPSSSVPPANRDSRPSATRRTRPAVGRPAGEDRPKARPPDRAGGALASCGRWAGDPSTTSD